MKFLLSPVLVICLLICPCTRPLAQSANKKDILGDWIQVKNPLPAKRGAPALNPGGLDGLGFSFYTNGNFDIKPGFFKHKSGITTYFGNRSKYRITNNTLYFLDPSRRKWDTCKLAKLTPDTLQFELAGGFATFKHYKPENQKNPEFDKIILSTSGCLGPCPIMSVMLDNDGTIIFKGLENTGKDGIYTAKITKEWFKQLQTNLFITDIRSLKNSYQGGWSDDETITTTFVKDGKIYKSIRDYGRAAPTQFVWAYMPLRYLYQKLTLKTAHYPNFLNSFIGSGWKKGNDIAVLSQSETFLLLDYLHKGKTFNGTYNPRFHLRAYFQASKPNDFNTDGRYYTFKINGKPTTIDIGFNFYDVNAEHWEWRKMTEND